MWTWVITGPTASGKTEFASSLGALAPERRLVNGDAFQRYHELPILSSQPQERADWQLLADRSLWQETSARTYADESFALLKSKPSIFVGTGLYLMGGLHGFDKPGVKATPFQKGARLSYRMIVLSPERSILYERINQRVDGMIEQGALEEARRVYEAWKSQNLVKPPSSFKAIGLQHLIRFLQGDWGWKQSLELWKRDTRRLAKRQWTWLRKFCPTSERCLWLEEPNLELSKAFLEMEEPSRGLTEEILFERLQKTS